MPLFAMISSPIGGKAVDRFGYGIPLTILMLWQFVMLMIIGRFTPGTPVPVVIACLALLGAAVGSSLTVCNASGMAAVDADRAGMGSGLLQASFNIPAALGVALISSLVGTLTTSWAVNKLNNPQLAATARSYSEAFESGSAQDATNTISSLPQAVQQSIVHAWESAYASSIGLGMTILGLFALGGALMVWLVIGKRRTPDHIEQIQATAV
jgi:MFS family permease